MIGCMLNSKNLRQLEVLVLQVSVVNGITSIIVLKSVILMLQYL